MTHYVTLNEDYKIF